MLTLWLLKICAEADFHPVLYHILPEFAIANSHFLQKLAGISYFSGKDYIKYHHERKSDGEEDSPCLGAILSVHLRYQLADDDI